MRLRRSAFAHVLKLGSGRSLLVHAVSQLRLAVDDDAAALLDAFAEPRELPGAFAALSANFRQEPRVLAGAVAALMERGFLTEHEPETEAAGFASALAETGARDPAAQLDKYRLGRREGALDYWAAHETRPLTALAAGGPRLDVALIGDCDVQMEAEFLRSRPAPEATSLCRRDLPRRSGPRRRASLRRHRRRRVARARRRCSKTGPAIISPRSAGC